MTAMIVCLNCHEAIPAEDFDTDECLWFPDDPGVPHFHTRPPREVCSDE